MIEFTALGQAYSYDPETGLVTAGGETREPTEAEAEVITLMGVSAAPPVEAPVPTVAEAAAATLREAREQLRAALADGQASPAEVAALKTPVVAALTGLPEVLDLNDPKDVAILVLANVCQALLSLVEQMGVGGKLTADLALSHEARIAALEA